MTMTMRPVRTIEFIGFSETNTIGYEDPGAAYYEDRYRQRVLQGLHRRAKEFGYTLTEVGALEGVS